MRLMKRRNFVIHTPEEIVRIREGFAARTCLERVWLSLEQLLKNFHEEQSLADGMQLAELRERVFSATPKTSDAFFEYFEKQGKLRRNGSLAALAGDYYARTGTALEYTECGIEV